MKRLGKIVLEFRRAMLGRRRSKGWCWLICQPLEAYLRLLGHDVKLVEGRVFARGEPCGEFHCWLRLADGTIIDPTADQFSMKLRPMPKVYIGELPRNYVIERKRGAPRRRLDNAVKGVPLQPVDLRGIALSK